jgi:hypothetical protein
MFLFSQMMHAFISFLPKALVGIAFAIGFIIGPVTGAAFSVWGMDSSKANWWFLPAVFALTLAITNIGFIIYFFQESLPKVKHY